MINVTRINHTPLVVNSDLIEFIETAPDTIITFSNGRNLMVLESPEEIVRQIIGYRRQLYRKLPVAPVQQQWNGPVPAPELMEKHENE